MSFSGLMNEEQCRKKQQKAQLLLRNRWLHLLNYSFKSKSAFGTCLLWFPYYWCSMHHRQMERQITSSC